MQRSVALLPALFFAVQALYHWSMGAAANALWMCNISNLLMALAIVARTRLLMRTAALWLLAGLPLWVIDLWQFRELSFSTFLGHLGGGAIALLTLHRVGMGRGVWLAALGWYLLVQQACRLWTRPELNVNLAHSSRGLGSLNIPNYHWYWLATTFLAATLLIALEKLCIYYGRVGEKRQGRD